MIWMRRLSNSNGGCRHFPHNVWSFCISLLFILVSWDVAWMVEKERGEDDGEARPHFLEARDRRTLETQNYGKCTNVFIRWDCITYKVEGAKTNTSSKTNTYECLPIANTL